MTREITIETTETILSRNDSSISASWCRQCGVGSQLVPFAGIVAGLGMDPRTLYRWLNEGRVHFQLSDKGGLTICWNTLSVLLEQNAEAVNEAPLHSAEALLPPGRRIERAAAKETRGHGPRRSS